MISSFKIKNFLSIKEEQTLSFEPALGATHNEAYLVQVAENIKLLKVAIMYGANASGKSNILIALSFFRTILTEAPSDRNSQLEFTPFMLDLESRSKKTGMEMIFYLKREKYRLYVKFDKERIYEEKLEFYPGTQPAVLYNRVYNAETDSTTVRFGAKLELSKESQRIIQGNTINNCSVLASFGKSNIEQSRLNLIFDFFDLNISKIPGNYFSLRGLLEENITKDSLLKKFVIKFLKASDFNISDMMLNDSYTTRELIFKHQTDSGEYLLPEAAESTGTLRYMNIAVLLKSLLLDSRIVYIDEIENSLHYELVSYLIKVFIVNSSSQSQLIFTTHDINLLDEDFIRRDTVWFTHKNSGGETNLSRLSSMGLHKNVSPYNAYKQGKLVELPFLDSIYLNMEEYE